MDLRDVKALYNLLYRSRCLDSYDTDLIEDAIFALKHGNDYRAHSSLRTLASNLRAKGSKYEAQNVERLL